MADDIEDGEIWWACCGGVVLTGDLKGLDNTDGVVVLKRRRLGAGVADMLTDPTARLFSRVNQDYWKAVGRT